LLAASCLVVLLYAFALLAFVPRYETNDDASMNLVVAGRILADAPDEHLVFSNVLVGLALQGLYRVWPEAPWYGGYLLAVTGLSLLAVAYALIRANPSGQQLLLTTGLMLAFGLPCVVWLQFTKAAFLAALAGLLLLLNVARGRGPFAQAWPAVGLLVLGCLVRFQSFLLAAAVLAPALAWTFWEQRRSRPARAALLLLAAVGVAGSGLERFNGWYYEQDPGWRGFYEFNALRAQFVDYGRVDYNERTKPAFDAVGWSAADVGMLYLWNFADRQRFSAAKFRAVLAAVGPEDRVHDERSWGDLADRLARDVGVLTLAAFGLGCLAWAGGGWRARVAPAACLAAAVGLCVFLFGYFYLPRHVLLPACGGFAAAAVAWSSARLTWRDLWPGTATAAAAARTATLALVAVLLAWWIGGAVELNAAEQARHEQAVQMTKALHPRPDQLFVLWGAAFPYELTVFPLEPLAVSPDFKAVSLGSGCQSPLTDRRLHEFGITDLYQALGQRRGVLLVMQGALAARILAAYMKEHYGVPIGFHRVFSHPALGDGGVYAVLDLSRLPPQTKAAP
jgi:hypothetical protein